eukprot:TRINITY_DN133_c0_g1_i1.p1 TRINITY_DN133_c0_g1~~TRINITY_DN133_c0_g1_i1.p1  ORF type:complete len:1995 (-),score=291.76 TRINITY_DN133_c0_g1_i1:835-6819(-)
MPWSSLRDIHLPLGSWIAMVFFLVGISSVSGLEISLKTSMPNGFEDDHFGKSIASNNQFLFVGAPHRNHFNCYDAGAVFVFTRDTDLVWSSHSILFENTVECQTLYGTAVAMGTTFAAVGASAQDHDSLVDVGVVYMYSLNGDTWDYQALISPNLSNIVGFGTTLAMTDSLLVVGAPFASYVTEKDGVVFVYLLNSQIWEQISILQGTGQSFSEFGASLTINGIHFIIGAPAYDKNELTDCGGAFPYIIESGSVSALNQNLTINPLEAGVRFGHSVSVLGNFLAVGSPQAAIEASLSVGAVSLFSYDPTTLLWVHMQKIQPADPISYIYFGFCVRLQADKLYVSAPADSFSSPAFMEVYIYNDPSWSLENYIPLEDSASNFKFGADISFSQQEMIVSSESVWKVLGSYSDSVSVFDTVPTTSKKVDNINPTPNIHLEQATPILLDDYNVATGIPSYTINNAHSLGRVHFSPKMEFRKRAIILTDVFATNGKAGDFFGHSIQFMDNCMVVGAPGYDSESSSDTGAIYIFRSQDIEYVEQQFIPSPERIPFDKFGTSLAISPSGIFVGAPYHTTGAESLSNGAVYEFTAESRIGWTQSFKRSDRTVQGANLGYSISFADSFIAVGAPFYQDGGDLWGRVFIYTLQGQEWMFSEILGGSIQGQLRFGASVAMRDGRLLVGDPENKKSFPNSGAVHIFTLSGAFWRLETDLEPDVPTTGLFFGESVSLNSTRALVGATKRMEEDLSATGLVFVFTLQGPSWILERKLSPATGASGGLFGFSVQFLDTAIIAGAPLHSESGQSESGLIATFEISQGGEITEATVFPSTIEAFSNFGSSISGFGAKYAVGCPKCSASERVCGVVYLFEYTPLVSTLVETISPQGTGSAALFGTSLSLGDNWLFVGAPGSRTNSGISQGATYTFTTEGSGFYENDILLPSDPLEGQSYGFALASNGLEIVVGCPKSTSRGQAETGSFYLYKDGGVQYTLDQKITTSQLLNNIYFGQSLAFHNGKLFVGAPGDDPSLSPPGGRVYLFTKVGATWTQIQEISSSLGQIGDWFGHAISLSGLFMVVSAPKYDDTLTNTGIVFVYTSTGGQWIETEVIKSPVLSEDGLFGLSVYNNQEVIFVGQPGTTLLTGEKGAVHAFVNTGSGWSTQDTGYFESDNTAFFGKSTVMEDGTAFAGASMFNPSNFLRGENVLKIRSLPNSLSKSNSPQGGNSQSVPPPNSVTSSRSKTQTDTYSRSPIPTPEPEPPQSITLVEPFPPDTFINDGIVSPSPRLLVENESSEPIQTPQKVQVSFSPSLPRGSTASPSSVGTENGVAYFEGFTFKGIHGTSYEITFFISDTELFAKWTIRVLTCQEIDPNSMSNDADGGLSCVCQAGYERVGESCQVIDQGISVFPTSGLVTSELDQSPSSFFEVVLTRMPTANVELSITSSDDSQSFIIPNTIVFSTGNWDIPQRVSLQGKPDPNNDEEDIPYTVYVGSPKTKDPFFANMRKVEVSVTNLNAVFPLLYELENPIITSSGGQFNISGGYFSPETRVQVTDNDKKITGQIETIFISPQKIMVNINMTFAQRSYLIVSVFNPDGASTKCPIASNQVSYGFPACSPENQLYVTTGCPPGTYGDGFYCTTCPDNAQCPGGARVWPKIGSWSPDEEIPPVSCYPSEACVGGRNSDCRGGYEEDFCSLCKDGFYRQGPVCRSCEDGDLNLTAVLAFSSLYAIIVSFVVIVMPSRFLFQFTIFMISVQQIVQIGLAGSDFIPISRRIFVSLSWFLFEFNFVRPGCNIPVYPYPQFYFMTLIAVSICALALVLCSILRGIMLYLKTKDSRAWYKYLVSKFFVRASESFVMLGYMIYILVTVRTIRLIDCKRVYNVQVMHIEMARECYADDHRIAAIFGWAIFTMFSVGYPIYSYYLLRCRVQNDAGVKTSSLLRSGEFLLSDMKPEYYWFRGCEMVSTFAICVISVTVHSVPWRLFLNGSIVQAHEHDSREFHDCFNLFRQSAAG